MNFKYEIDQKVLYQGEAKIVISRFKKSNSSKMYILNGVANAVSEAYIGTWSERYCVNRF
jgi:hypothetical protein